MEEYGYDAIFVTEVPAYLRCAACHLVLRDPLQILGCNHRYCFQCFEKLKRYSNQFNSKLLCVADQTQIDISKVHKDITIEKIINELQVLCAYCGNGCNWSGSLKNLKDHLDNCNQGDIENLSVPDLLKKLCKRVNCCEKSLKDKGQAILLLNNSLIESKEETIIVKNEFEKYREQTKKEILYLKFQIINETKLFHKKDEESTIELQRINIEIDEKMKSVKEYCKDIKSEVDKENIELKIQLKEVKNQCAVDKRELAELKVKFDNLPKLPDDIEANTSIMLQVENLNNTFLSKLKSVNNQVENVKCCCDKTNQEIDGIKKDFERLNEQLTNNMKEEIDEVKNNFEKLNEKLTNNMKEEIDGIKKDFEKLNEKLTNNMKEEIDEVKKRKKRKK